MDNLQIIFTNMVDFCFEADMIEDEGIDKFNISTNQLIFLNEKSKGVIFYDFFRSEVLDELIDVMDVWNNRASTKVYGKNSYIHYCPTDDSLSIIDGEVGWKVIEWINPLSFRIVWKRLSYDDWIQLQNEDPFGDELDFTQF